MKHLNQIDKCRFLNEIYNYKSNPKEFTYIGKAPSIVVFSSPENKFCIELEPALEIMAKRGKNKYKIYYVNTLQEPEMAQNFSPDKIPVIYLCPIGTRPTIVTDTINIREIFRLADRLLDKNPV